MRPFSPRMFPDRAYLLALAEGQDASGGVVESYPTPTGPGLPCRFRYVNSTSRAATGLAGEAESSPVQVQVAFPADPGAKKGDRIRRVGSAEDLRVLGAARPRGADGVLFVAHCEAIE